MEKRAFDIKNFLIKLFLCIAAMGSICGMPFMSCKDCSRQTVNQPDRDTISFKVPTSAIYDSIQAMNGIMDKLNPAEKQPRIKSWFIKDYEPDIIDINGNIFKFKNLKTQDFNIFVELDSIDRQRFHNLIVYFVTNNLTSCFDERLGITSKHEYFYLYKNYENINEEEYNRFILLYDTNFNYDSDSVKQTFKVLDKRDGLVLLKENYHKYLKDQNN
jgi:hypothetical protein